MEEKTSLVKVLGRTMDEDIIITLDVDWAPDWCIQRVADALIRENIKATWFITHDSPAIQDLKQNSDLFELGVHPNFNEGSTQGNDVQEIMDYLISIVPDAQSLRTHGLFYSFRTIEYLNFHYDIKYDSSLLLWNTAHINPHKLYLSKNRFVIRLPIFWEDDVEMRTFSPNFSLKPPRYNAPGMKIFNFHPIHICLNSCSLGNYDACKAMNSSITCLTKEKVAPFIHQGLGTKMLFRELIDHLVANSRTGATIAEIGDAFCSNCSY